MSDIILRNPDTSRSFVRRWGLHSFVREAWPQVESVEFLDEPHIKLICRHLEACALRATRSFGLERQPWMEGLDEISDLVIAVSPGSSKTLVSSVFFPAWLWTFAPQAKLIMTSYSEQLVTRDAKRSFELMSSDWYRERWPELVIMGGERAAMQNFTNTMRGVRLSVPMSGQVTGFHAHILVSDDPTKPQDLQLGGESAQAALEKVRDKWDTTFSSRSAHPPTFTRVVIAQRLAQGDLSGVMIERGAQHLYLPMEHVAEKSYRSRWGDDWRVSEGELMAPRRFPAEVISARKQYLSAREWSAQYQQSPSPADGSIFQREWFNQLYEGSPWGFSKLTVSVDSSLKNTTGSDYTVIQVWSKAGPAKYYLVDQVRSRMSFSDQLKAIKVMRQKWANVGNVLVEAKANGDAIIDSLQRQLPGVIAVHPMGGKEARANATEYLWNSGCVWLPKNAPWLDHFIEEHILFPVGLHDDTVDAASMYLTWASARDKRELQKKAMENVRTGVHRLFVRGVDGKL